MTEPLAAADPLWDGPETTFKALLFTDIEASTELWEQAPDEMEPAVLWHHDVVREQLLRNGGRLVTLMGDGTYSVFADAAAAVRAAIGIQRTMTARSPGSLGRLRVRMGIHAGLCRTYQDEVYGPNVNLAARVANSANGGQIVITAAAVEACRSHAVAGGTFVDLGSHRFRGVHEPVTVFGVAAPGIRAAFPRLRSEESGLGDLPDEPTPLFGRAGLISHVEDLVRLHRVVSVVGPGGIGKSRLAWRVAAQARRPFSSGVRYIDIGSASPGDDIARLVAGALRLHGEAGGDHLDALVTALRPVRLLLVLDDCEGAIDDVRRLALSITASCPGVHLLVTSRLPLDIPDEAAVPVPPLGIPDGTDANDPSLVEATASIALFAERAERAVPGFVLNAANLAHVVAVCRALDGVPLSIELAAARLDVEPLSGLARAGPSLTGRLLTGAGSRAPSVADVLSWSIEQLPADDLAVFTELSVFAGTFTRDMALGLIDRPERSVHEAIDHLVRSALLVRTESGGERLRLLDLARTQAAERLTPALRSSGRTRYLALMRNRARELGTMIRDSREQQAVTELKTDWPNQRAAMQAAIAASDWASAADLLVNLFQFCHFQLIGEAIDWAVLVHEALPTDHDQWADVTGAAALGSWFRGDLDRAIALAEQAIAARPDAPLFWARLALLDSLVYLDRPAEEVGPRYMELVSHSRAAADPFWQINGLGYEALGYVRLGRVEQAEERAKRALSMAVELGNPDCLHWALYARGSLFAGRDDVVAARAFEDAIDAATSVDSRWNVCIDLIALVRVQRRSGERESATRRLLDLLSLIIESGNRSQIGESLLEGAQLLADCGADELAATLFQAHLRYPTLRSPSDGIRPDELETRLRNRLGERWESVANVLLTMPEHRLLDHCRAGLESSLHHA